MVTVEFDLSMQITWLQMSLHYKICLISKELIVLHLTVVNVSTDQCRRFILDRYAAMHL